jgi:hypothetical protein
MYDTYIPKYIMTFSSSGMCRDSVSIIQAWQRLKQCVLNAETNDGSTMQYSPISKDGMLPSFGGSTSLQLQQLVVSARLFARLHTLGNGKLNIPHLIQQLVFASAGTVAVLEAEGRGHTGTADSPRQQSNLSGQNPWIAAQPCPPVRSS